MSVKNWLEITDAIGITAKAGRYGGTYAHKDIAFHFGMWISPKFQLLLVKEYQRLKEDESDRHKMEWNFQRTLSKVNYHIHTDAIKETLIPMEISRNQSVIIYANEADVLNMALFGKTAKQWREENPDKKSEYPRLCNYRTAGSTFQYGKHQCLTDPPRLDPIGTLDSAQSDGHFAD